MKSVFIVILHFNGAKDTRECLRSLAKIDTNNYSISIVVVDNGSKSKFQIKNRGKIPVRVVYNQSNLGFAGGNNIGIKIGLEQGADYILLLNNDTLVDKSFLLKLMEVMDSDEKIGILSPKIYFAKGFEFHKDRYKEQERGKVLWYTGGIMDWKNVIGRHRGVDEVDKGQYDKIEPTDFTSGCCMLVRRKVFEEIGMLDHRYFLYYEDADFSIRTRRKGYKILYVPESLVWHKNASSAGGSGSALQDYFISRNRMLFGMTYASPRTKFSLLRESLSILIFGRKWQRLGVVDFYLRKYGKGRLPI